MTPTAPARPEPFFRRLRRAWYHAPFLLHAFAFALLVYAWLFVIDVDRPPEDPGSGIVRAVVALVAGLVVAGGRRVTRLYHPGAPTPVEVSEAAEDGELPPGADRVAWQGALDRRRREIRQEAWALPFGLVLLVALAFLLPRAGSSLPLATVAILAVFVPYATSLFVSRPRRRDSVDALLIPLQEQSRRDDEERAGWAPPSPDDRIPPADG